tara:strand:- start:2299 stop:2577 length:279 start_codon:yes stop_codon:yes gene_type:complete
MSEIKDPKKSTYITELNKRKDNYPEPIYKKVVVTAEVEMWLESDKINIDYAIGCASFLLDAGKERRVDFKQEDGREILHTIHYKDVKTFKYD